MAIVDRVKGICLKPAAEWATIAEETTSTGALFKGYVVPLAAIGPIAGFVGGSVIGRSMPFIGTWRIGFGAGLAMAVTTFVLALVGVFVLSLIINALAPTFGAQKNSAQALKVAVYSYTPAWVAGALQILPMLGILGLLAGLYGLYLLYLGLPRLMKCPPEKAIGYTAVSVVCAIVLSVVFGAVATAVARPGLMGVAGLGDVSQRVGSGSVRFDKDSALGKLQALGEAAQESARKMDEANKSGDPKAQAAAAMQGLGTLLGGGKRVDPIDIDQLKPFVPETFAGLARRSSNAEKSGMMGLSVSKAAATYGDGADKSVSLTVSDTGGASGLLGLAGWVRLQGEREDESGFERTATVDGRLVHEKGSKQAGGSNEYAVVLGQRFVVSAHGRGVDLPTLKSAVGGLDLGKLEALKDVGVQK